jgi:alpha-L-rhamnosidase
MGATTIWERWDSLLPDGRLNTGEMTSFNHYAFGAVVDWMHRTIAGLVPAAPGYRRIRFKPRPGADFQEARASLLTPYGRAAIDWRMIGNSLDLEVRVPANTTAEVHPPDGSPPFEISSGTHTWRLPLRRPPSAQLGTDLEPIAPLMPTPRP